MAAESVTRVVYEALADFSSLHAAAAGAVADLDAIQAKEAEVNAASASGSKESTAAQDSNNEALKKKPGLLSRIADALSGSSRVEREFSSATDDSTRKVEAQNKALNDSIKAKSEAQKATSKIKTEVSGWGAAMKNAVKDAENLAAATDSNTTKTSRFGTALRSTLRDLTDSDVVARRAASGFDMLGNGMSKFLTAGMGRGGAAPLLLLLPLIAGILALVNPVVAGIGAIGGALFGLISNLGSLVGVLTVIPGGIAAFVTSLGVLKLAFSGVGTALKDYQTLQQTAVTDTKAHAAALQAYEADLKKLSPAAQTFTKWLVSMSGAWKDLKSSISQNFFSRFVGDLSGVGPVFQAITTVMNKAAGAVGGVVDQFLKLMETTGAQKGLSIFGDQNAQLISTMGSGLLSILDTIGKLVVAAGPFTQLVADGLAKSADSLDRIVTKASTDGSLASWLSHVYDNLKLWWGIVSDVAKTIFNYGSAASSFGTWITKGLKSVTDGWLAASEAALKPGSSFQTWLGNIKPLVTALADTIGKFLTWWNQNATDQGNITKMLTMIKDINDHLGPALGDLLKTMANTTIGPDLIKFISTLVDMISTIMSHGGAQVIEGVIHFLTELASFLDTVGKIPGVGSTLTTVAAALLAISVLSFANKFLPLISAISWLLRLAGAEGPLTKIFNTLSGYKGPVGGAGGTTRTTTGGGSTVITGSGKGRGAVKDSPSAGSIKDELTGGSGETLITGGKTSGKLGRLGKLAGGALGHLGGILGLLGLGAEVYGAVSDPTKPQKNFDASNNNWAGTAAATGLGALGGSEFGPLGTVVGAGVGAMGATTGSNGRSVLKNVTDPHQWGIGAKQIGGFLGQGLQTPVKGADFLGKFDTNFLKGADTEAQKQLNKVSKKIQDFVQKTLPSLVKKGGKGLWNGLEDASKWLVKQNKSFTTWVKDLPKDIGRNAHLLWDALGTANKWLNSRSKELSKWFGDLPKNTGNWAGDVWKNLKKANDWLGDRHDELVKWFGALPKNIGTWAGDVWKNVKKANDWLGARHDELSKWFASLPGSIGTWAGDVWKNIKKANTWLNDRSHELSTWFGSLPGSVSHWAGDVWKNMKSIAGWIDIQAGKLAAWVRGIPGQIAAAIGSGWNSAPTPNHPHYGGMIHRAHGGEVPGFGNTDSVGAMLTPGEIVINKQIVEAVGAQNLLDLNSGLVTYSQMLNKAMATQPHSKLKDTSPGFMSGTGLSGHGALASQSFNTLSLPNSNSSSTVHSSGTHIGQIVVNNPKPEPASASLPRSLRKASYLTLARGR